MKFFILVQKKMISDTWDRGILLCTKSDKIEKVT